MISTTSLILLIKLTHILLLSVPFLAVDMHHYVASVMGAMIPRCCNNSSSAFNFPCMQRAQFKESLHRMIWALYRNTFENFDSKYSRVIPK